ncbi:hypothetical protein L332_08075 [Agrococcus pavilionensis RW1]|uniref:Potassium channel domain-containing protein n=1 Tax=Agrococcus pavilionensis RW1 TaxID=1330458 RepID=U1LPQ8_9MICO|nr:potassium channel family protein [Agrococcus pavilionensis]ERG64404.1 hypothetical protein L332_08075 [Agrococcus pavilionensis RW1]
MDAVLTIVGVAIIAIGLWDMFHTLLHPSGRGALSRRLLAATWALTKPFRRRLGSVAGAAGMLLVVLLWVVLQGLGWALIYLPHMPAEFTYSPGLDADDYAPFAESLYVSFVTLTTLGFGDVLAVTSWIRLVAPLEALTGFALLTAAMTWFSQIYPPLSRRRALSLQLDGLAEAGYAEAVPELDVGSLSRVLDSVAGKAAEVRVDFAQHSEGFYFREETPALALARQLPYALELKDAALVRQEPVVRLSAQQLARVLDQLAETLRSQYRLRGDDARAVFAAFATDHRHEARA